jgi:hypothetical protein
MVDTTIPSTTSPSTTPTTSGHKMKVMKDNTNLDPQNITGNQNLYLLICEAIFAVARWTCKDRVGDGYRRKGGSALKPTLVVLAVHALAIVQPVT